MGRPTHGRTSGSQANHKLVAFHFARVRHLLSPCLRMCSHENSPQKRHQKVWMIIPNKISNAPTQRDQATISLAQETEVLSGGCKMTRSNNSTGRRFFVWAIVVGLLALCSSALLPLDTAFAQGSIRTEAPASRSAAAMRRSCASGATCRAFFEGRRRNVCNATHQAGESSQPLSRRTICRPWLTAAVATERQIGRLRSLPITVSFREPAPNAITKVRQ
jgi:hypothetical protein